MSTRMLERHHHGIESRFVSVILAVYLVFNMVDPALLMMHVQQSVVYKVASLTSHTGMLSIGLLVFAAGLIPYAAQQAFAPNHQWRRHVTKVAICALCLGGVAWLFLAYLSRNLDIETVTGIYIRNGAVQIVFGFALALGLNHQMQRQDIEGTNET